MAWKADRIDAAVIALLEKGRERREAKEGEAGGPGVEDGGMVEWHLIADRPAIRSHPLRWVDFVDLPSGVPGKLEMVETPP